MIPYEIFRTDFQRESLLELGWWVAENGVQREGPFQAARDPLLRRPPRPHVDPVEAAKEAGLLLDHSILPIQGPPGSGKTYTGACMIVELIRHGKRVGIAAVSHKVISKLLKEVCEAAPKARACFHAIQKVEGDGYDIQW